MSLKTYPSCGAFRGICACCKEKQKWKVEHEKLDADRDYELKTVNQNYKTLLEVNISTTHTLLKLRSKQRKLRTELKAFCEWLDLHFDLLGPTMRKEYLEKKKSLGLNK